MEDLDTTVNMPLETYNQLTELSDISGLGKREILIFVIIQFRQKKPQQEKLYCNIKYQEKHKEWKKFHVKINGVEREKTYDMRKIYKKSFSFIVSLAIVLYGHLLLKKDKTTIASFEAFMYNYTSESYNYCSFEENGEKTMIIKWGIKKEKSKMKN